MRMFYKFNNAYYTYIKLKNINAMQALKRDLNIKNNK